MRITSGSTAMARAMHSRCCWPPDMPRADVLRRSLTSSQSAAPRSERSTMSSSSPFFRVPFTLGPKATFSYTLFGKGLGFWKTIPIRRRTSVADTSEA